MRVLVRGAADKARDALRGMHDVRGEENRSGGRGRDFGAGDYRGVPSMGGGRERSYDEMKAIGMSDAEISNVLSDRNTSDAEKAAGIVKRESNTQGIDHKYLAAQRGLFGEQAEAFSKKFSEALDREMAAFQDNGRRMTISTPSGYIDRYAGHFNRAADTAAGQVRSDERRARVAARLDISIDRKHAGSVDMASEEDADKLTTILGQLESAASRSSRRRIV